FSFCAKRRRAFSNSAECFAEVASSTHERHREIVLEYMVSLISGRQYFGLIDVVDAKLLEHLRLDKMANAAFRHYRNRDGVHDFADFFWRRHARNAALCTDLRRHPFESHDSSSASALSDLGLLGGRDVHDHTALEHFRQANLQAP